MELLSELTAHRTLALRDAVANDPHIAFVAALHVLCLKLFYRYALDTCLEIDPKSAMFSAQAPGLADSVSAKAIAARHTHWAGQLPKEPGELWGALLATDADSRQALFAHCASLTVNAVHEAYNRRPKALTHADSIAQAVKLDMAAVGWHATAENYLGRVTKGHILEAVREARGEAAAQRIGHLKKAEMASEAASLLANSGWVPEPLRTRGQVMVVIVNAAESQDNLGEAQSAEDDGEPAMDEEHERADTVDEPTKAHSVAAE